MNICVVNGQVMPLEEAAIPLSDRGFLYGDTVFETIAVHAGTPFGLSEHEARLEAGLSLFGYPVAAAMEEARSALSLLLEEGLGDAVLRLTVSRGTAPRGLGTKAANAPRAVAAAFPAPALAESTAHGISAVLTERRRPHPDCLPPTVKCGNYLPNVLAAQDAEAAGASEALMLDWAGEGAACAVTGNLFAETKSGLVTPPPSSGALVGTMRGRIMRIAAAQGIPVHERGLPEEALLDADALFMSNSVRGIAWISALGGTAKAKGEIASLLHASLRQEILAKCGGTFLPEW